MHWTIADVAAATGGRRVSGHPEAELTRVSLDSRRTEPGDLFVAVVAERDGHLFVGAALDAGAGAVLVEDAGPIAQAGRGGVVVVADTGLALLDLGRAARRRMQAAVIGITGSVGKTSTKDLTAAALRRRWRTAASERSFNTELGVPLTLANAPDDTEVAVIEMGARGPGHIALLCDVARPGIAVVTSVAAVHTELFGSLAAVAAAKGELAEAVPAGGTVVLNADDPAVAAMAGRTASGVEILRYSASGDRLADIVASGVTVDDELRPSFSVATPWGSAEVRLGIRGLHQVGNALAAITVALRCDVPLDDVVDGLAGADISPWRMALEHTGSGAAVLNDAYNANPTSMEAALRSLARVPASRRIAVLGEMAELGPDGAGLHLAVTALADQLGVAVIAVGTALYGVPPVPDVDAAVAAVGPLGAGDAVLVKASRVVGLERVAQRLVASDPNRHAPS